LVWSMLKLPPNREKTAKGLKHLKQNSDVSSKTQEVFAWIDSLVHHKHNFDSLQNGVVLCQLINSLKPNTIKESLDPSHSTENIANFLRCCETEFGLAKNVLFVPEDLASAKDKPQKILNTLVKLRQKTTPPSTSSKKKIQNHTEGKLDGSPTIVETTVHPIKNSEGSLLRFRTFYYNMIGEAVFLSGSNEKLGNDNVKNAVRMLYEGDGEWELEIYVKDKVDLSYKYLVMPEDLSQIHYESKTFKHTVEHPMEIIDAIC